MILGPRAPGFALIADARQRGSEAPFIAISGQDYDPTALERVGFAAYMRKPLDTTSWSTPSWPFCGVGSAVRRWPPAVASMLCCAPRARRGTDSPDRGPDLERPRV